MSISSPVTVCNIQLLNAIDFLKDTGGKFAPKSFNMDIDTHDSSTKNSLFGTFSRCTRWRLSKKLLENLPNDRVLHPLTLRQDFIESESDGVLYCHHALFIPLLTLLEVLWGETLAFGIEAEPPCRTFVVDPGDANQLEEARGRLDIMITAYKKAEDEPTYPILLFEAKAPGTILPQEWTAAYKTSLNDDEKGDSDSEMEEIPSPEGNAFHISKQLRKYLSGFESRRIVCGDGKNLVGVRLTHQALQRCATGDDLAANMFIETKPKRFLQALFCVAVEGLLEYGLID